MAEEPTIYPQKVTIFETLPCCHQSQFNFDNVINSQEAGKYFPEKLSAADIIKPSLLETHSPIIKLGRGLLHLDYSVMFDAECGFIEKQKKSDTVQCVEDLFKSSYEESNDVIHPLDRLIMLLECSNDVLKQDIITKLAKCQLAIPLILPNYSCHMTNLKFYEWCLRRIEIAWKPTPEECCRVTELANVPSTFVSFIRISNSQMSKSRLASRVIRNGKDDKHSYFIDREDSNCVSNKLVSAGLVDIFWNAPKGDADDSFKNPVIVFNLHGCASFYNRQTTFLCAVSHLLFVFIDDNFDQSNHSRVLEFLSLSNAKICFLYRFTTPDVQKRFAETLKKTNIIRENKLLQPIDIQKINLENVADNVKSCINNENLKLEKLSEVFRLAENFDMVLDNANLNLHEILPFVLSLNHMVDVTPKNELLQLQQYLQDIVPIIKESKRLRNKRGIPLNIYINQLQEKLLDHEITQKKKLIELLKDPDSFQSNLLLSFGNASTTQEKLLCFLRSLSISLDARARKVLPKLREHYVQLREDTLSMKEENPTEQATLQSKIKAVLHQLQNESFGVEHLMREISTSFHLYQCTEYQICLEPFTKVMQALPRIQAQMLAYGVPMEVMNGDCGFVDVLWLQKVFQELCYIVGTDEHVCVITVLGVQSSGKSTLLNSMFGINFAVSSGRCTKGIYAQLIELDQSLAQKLGCRYVIILDTEGLRAPELKVIKDLAAADTIRDNELATFIVGSADLTIINVMGETDSDIHETLQITVHAMLRMKRADLSPMCMMVHQNVNDVMVKENSIQARENIKNFLDETTMEASRQESNETSIRCFADVIDFNFADPTQICYLPSLFNGSHINSKYTTKVKELRSTVFKRLEKKANRFIHFSELSDRIKDLWNAILEEDFVFSFKNALAIKAYQQLEANIIIWTRSLTKVSEEKVCEIRNKIKQCRQKPEELGKILKDDLVQHMKKHLQQILDEDLLLFMEHQENKIMVQWYETTQHQLQYYSDELIEKNWRECSTYLQRKTTEFALADSTKQHEQMLRQIAKKQLHTLKLKHSKKLNENELKKEFETFWCNVIDKLKVKCDVTKIEIANIEQIVCYVIFKVGILPDNAQKFFHERCRDTPNQDAKDITESDWKIYAKPTNIKTFFKDFFHIKDIALNNSLTAANKKWISDMEQTLATYQQEARAVILNQPYQILDKIHNEMRNFEATENVRFTGKYRALLAYTFYRKAIPSFEIQQCAYIQANDPLLRLELKYKEPFWSLFNATCMNLQTEQHIVEAISEIISSAVITEIECSLPSVIEDFISTSDVQFMSNKFTLLAIMLYEFGETLNSSSLAEPFGKKIFENFCSLFKDPFKFMEHFFTQKVEAEYFSSKKRVEKIVGVKVIDYKKLVENIIQSRLASETITDWLTMMQNEINQSNKLSVDFLVVLNNSLPENDETIVNRKMNKSDMEEFKDNMVQTTLKKLQMIHICVKKDHFTKAASKILSSRLLIGCKERCPFCGSFCELSTNGHATSHRSRSHWPIGLITYHFVTNKKLDSDICTSEIASDGKRFQNKDTKGQYCLFKDYKQYYPKWDIPADASLECSLFWKWFLGHYGDHLAKYYNLEPPDCPSFWQKIQFEQVKAAIEKEYNITLKVLKRSSILKKEMEQNIIGQAMAVEAAANAIERKEENRDQAGMGCPLVLMFLGPNGTGKTEMAKYISNYWNKNNGVDLIQLNMSEYCGEHSMSKLIGSYQGSNDGNTALVDKLKQHPTAVILIDGIEKATDSIRTILFQMFLNGQLTDWKNKTVHFPNTVFILTSNLCADLIANHVEILRCNGTVENIEFSKEFQDECLRPELKMALKHEALFNQIQEFVCFIPFTRNDMEKLADLEMKHWQTKLNNECKAKLMWSCGVIQFLISHFVYQKGMRSIKNACIRYVASVISDEIKNIREHSHVFLSVIPHPYGLKKSSIKVTITFDDED